MTAAERPAEFYRAPGGGSVMVPAQICRLLSKDAHLTELRIRLRGSDPEYYEVLVAMQTEGALHAERLAAGSSTRTVPANEREPESELVRFTAPAAAGRLGCTARAVQKACASGRLRGELVGGRWLIDAEDLQDYREARDGYGSRT